MMNVKEIKKHDLSCPNVFKSYRNLNVSLSIAQFGLYSKTNRMCYIDTVLVCTQI